MLTGGGGGTFLKRYNFLFVCLFNWLDDSYDFHELLFKQYEYSHIALNIGHSNACLYSAVLKIWAKEKENSKLGSEPHFFFFFFFFFQAYREINEHNFKSTIE